MLIRTVFVFLFNMPIQSLLGVELSMTPPIKLFLTEHFRVFNQSSTNAVTINILKQTNELKKLSTLYLITYET